MSTATRVLRWKERRTLLPIWISLGVLFLFALFIASSARTFSEHFLPFSYLTLFWTGSCLIALATGVMLFVPEREQETDLFLGQFPVTSKTVASAKITEALLVLMCFVLVTGVLISVAFWLKREQFLWNELDFATFSATAFVPVHTFLWSCLFSLRFRNSLAALICTVLCTAFGWFVTMLGAGYFISLIPGTNQVENFNQEKCLIGFQALITLILIGAVFRLGSTWLRGARESDLTEKVAVRDQAVSDLASQSQHASTYSYSSLLWLGMRLNWVPVSILCVAMVVCSLFFASFFYPNVANTAKPIANVRVLFAFCAIFGAFAGLAIFRGDQSNRSFLFFQHQADFPRRVWLSRMVLLGIMLLVATISIWWVVSSVRSSMQASFANSLIGWQTSTWNGVLVFLTAAAMTQLISIVCRSGVITFFMALITIVVTGAWSSIVLTTDSRLVMLVGPVIVMCFVATWWYAPRWISQRKPIRSIATTVGMAIAVFVASSVGFVWHRVAVPAAEVSAEYRQAFDAHDQFLKTNRVRLKSVFQLKEAMASIDLGLNADALEKLSAANRKNPAQWPDKSLKKFVDNHRSKLQNVQEAVADDLIYHWTTPTSLQLSKTQYESVARVLAMSSEYYRREKDVLKLLDSLTAEVQAAWRLNPKPASHTAKTIMKFCKWSELEGQTRKELGMGLDTLRQLRAEIFDRFSERIHHEVYFDIRRDFRDGSPDRNFLVGVLEEGPSYWEKIRERRIRMHEFTQVAHAIWKGEKQPIEFWLPYSFYIPTSQFSGVWEMNEFVALDQTIAYASVRIALQIHRLEHGSYPETLKQLTTNDALTNGELPHDRLYGISFAYFPKGLDQVAFLPQSSAFHFREASTQNAYPSSTGIEPNKPFVLPLAGNFQKLPLLIQPGGDEFKFSSGYRYVAPSVNGSDLRLFFSIRGADYTLPVVDLSSKDETSEDEDQEIER